MSGQLPSTVAPSRNDSLGDAKPEARRSKETIRPEPPENPGEKR
jgi:hypothetical protein